MFVLVIFKLNLLGYHVFITRSQGHIYETIMYTLQFELSMLKLIQKICLDDIWAMSKIGHVLSKAGTRFGRVVSIGDLEPSIPD